MAHPLNGRCVAIRKEKQDKMFATILEKMRVAINDECEKPDGKFDARDLRKLQKEMYGL